jgi:hypothetical protein
MDTNNIENRMPYYPTDEPWTHALVPAVHTQSSPLNTHELRPVLSHEDRHYAPNLFSHHICPHRPQNSNLNPHPYPNPNQPQNHPRLSQNMCHSTQSTLPFTPNTQVHQNPNPNPTTATHTCTPEGWGDWPPSPLSAFNIDTPNFPNHLPHA